MDRRAFLAAPLVLAKSVNGVTATHTTPVTVTIGEPTITLGPGVDPASVAKLVAQALRENTAGLATAIARGRA